MKIVAVIFNIVLFMFTCFVLVSDGPPTDANYIVFAIWSLLTMILSAVVISFIGTRNGWLGLHAREKVQEEQKKLDTQSSPKTIMRIVAIICNIIFFGFVCWALVDQYPHPKESGFIPFVVLMILTPILNLVVLVFTQGSGRRSTRP